MTSLPASSSRWNGASAPPAKARSSSFWARPGYPATPPGWIIATAPPIGITRRPRKSTSVSPRIASPSPARRRIGSAHTPRDLGVVLVIGVNERVERGPGNGSFYNSSLTYDATGQLVNHHRKLMPTYTERLIWGQGDGAGLRAVDTAAGRLSSLVCWEHWMPLARQALHDSGEQIRVALWPTVKEMHQVASRQYAFEGRCFVLAAGSILLAEDTRRPSWPYPTSSPPRRKRPSCAAARRSSPPDGAYLVGPLWDEEGILRAELDLRAITREQMALNVSGHYARPDVFRFRVRRKRSC